MSGAGSLQDAWAKLPFMNSALQGKALIRAGGIGYTVTVSAFATGAGATGA